MGLDQYIYAKAFSDEREYKAFLENRNDITEFNFTLASVDYNYRAAGEPFGTMISQAHEIIGNLEYEYLSLPEIAYFRKQYAIQQWFSEKVLRGTHDCIETVIPEEVMNEFVEIGKKVLGSFKRELVAYAKSDNGLELPLWEYTYGDFRNAVVALFKYAQKAEKQDWILPPETSEAVMYEEIGQMIAEKCSKEINALMPPHSNFFASCSMWPLWWIEQMQEAIYRIELFRKEIQPDDKVVYTYMGSW